MGNAKGFRRSVMAIQNENDNVSRARKPHARELARSMGRHNVGAIVENGDDYFWVPLEPAKTLMASEGARSIVNNEYIDVLATSFDKKAWKSGQEDGGVYAKDDSYQLQIGNHTVPAVRLTAEEAQNLGGATMRVALVGDGARSPRLVPTSYMAEVRRRGFGATRLPRYNRIEPVSLAKVAQEKGYEGAGGLREPDQRTTDAIEGMNDRTAQQSIDQLARMRHVDGLAGGHSSNHSHHSHHSQQMSAAPQHPALDRPHVAESHHWGQDPEKDRELAAQRNRSNGLNKNQDSDRLMAEIKDALYAKAMKPSGRDNSHHNDTFASKWTGKGGLGERDAAREQEYLAGRERTRELKIAAREAKQLKDTWKEDNKQKFANCRGNPEAIAALLIEQREAYKAIDKHYGLNPTRSGESTLAQNFQGEAHHGVNGPQGRGPRGRNA